MTVAVLPDTYLWSKPLSHIVTHLGAVVFQHTDDTEGRVCWSDFKLLLKPSSPIMHSCCLSLALLFTTAAMPGCDINNSSAPPVSNHSTLISASVTTGGLPCCTLAVTSLTQHATHLTVPHASGPYVACVILMLTFLFIMYRNTTWRYVCALSSRSALCLLAYSSDP